MSLQAMNWEIDCFQNIPLAGLVHYSKTCTYAQKVELMFLHKRQLTITIILVFIASYFAADATHAAVMASQEALDAARERALNLGISFSTVCIMGVKADNTLWRIGEATVLQDQYSNDEYIWLTGHSTRLGEFIAYEFYNGMSIIDSYYSSGPVARVSAEHLTVHPAYSGSIESMDTAIIHVPGGIDGIPGAKLYTGPTILGIVLDVVDYGNPAIVNQPEMAWDGFSPAVIIAIYCGSADCA